MKKLFAISGLLLLFGCADLAVKPPSPWEQSNYNVVTNKTEVVTPAYTTEVAGIEVVVPETTNLLESYEFLPSEKTKAIQETGKVIGSFWGVGELVSGLIGGVFGLWGVLRSRKSNKTAAALVQIIETGRVLLKETPQGQRLDDKWTLWMVKHQAEQGIINEVVKLMGQAVDNESAKVVSQKILDLMKRDEDPQT
jgi:hypothetical protein